MHEFVCCSCTYLLKKRTLCLCIFLQFTKVMHKLVKVTVILGLREKYLSFDDKTIYLKN